jgi:hypothetical protein
MAAVAGASVCLAMSIAWEWRFAASCLWLLVSERELRVIANGHKRYTGIRIDANGDTALLTPDGAHLPVKLLTGSVVLPSLAWLRFKGSDGCRGVELITRKSPENKAWRRLQVIWRHVGASG